MSEAPPGYDGEAPDLPQPTVLASQPIYEGRIISIHVDRVALPGGGTATREVVEHPGAVVIAALDERQRVYLVRQYRHAIGRALLELPAGGLEKGEDPLTAAKRELREEVGVEAAEWVHLGSFYSSPGFANELLHAFVARGLRVVGRDPDEDEDLEVVRQGLAGMVLHIDDIQDAKTLATLALLLLDRGRPGMG
jgi:ADP-ribose pyrophosphatase